MRENITFDNSVGIFTRNKKSSLFVFCKNYSTNDNNTFIPAGKYLCCNCSEANRGPTLDEMVKKIKHVYQTNVDFIVETIVFTGMFQ